MWLLVVIPFMGMRRTRFGIEILIEIKKKVQEKINSFLYNIVTHY
jgi:hypothetical protein